MRVHIIMIHRGTALTAWLLHVLLVGSIILATGVVGFGDDDWGDDDEGTSRTKAPFEVDGEVRHDWGQNNLREWDGAVLHCSFPRRPCAHQAPALAASWHAGGPVAVRGLLTSGSYATLLDRKENVL